MQNIGKGGSKELRGYCNESGNTLLWLGSEKCLYLDSILKIAPRGFTEVLDLGCEGKKTLMTSLG